jgi:hypothetical protein
LALALFLVAAPSLAGPTAHLLTEDAQIVPEGDVALEQWVCAQTRIPDAPTRPVLYYVWWAPYFGVSNHLEVALPLQVYAASGDTELQSVGLDIRYRLQPRERDEGFQPLVRLSYEQRLSSDLGPPRATLDFVATYGAPTTARLNFNLGALAGLPFLENASTPPSLTGTASVGASYPLREGLRLAAEASGELGLVNAPSSSRLYAGPSLYWARGPFWLTFGSLVGLTPSTPRFFPKVLWAVAL